MGKSGQNEDITLSSLSYSQTVQMTLPRWMGLAGLPWHYSAVQLHLHWGNGVGVATGSEHTINGRSSSAEVCTC